jgi:hypothetical protein
MLLQVDRHIETLCVQCLGQQAVVIAGRLARKALKPRRLTIAGSSVDSSLSAITALLATEQHHPMFQRVQQLTFEHALPKALPPVSEELALGSESVCHCGPHTGFCSMPAMPLCLALSLLCCQPPAAQDVFASMPLLTHLALWPNLDKQGAQMLAGVRLDTLHSLNVRMDLCHAWFLKGCTQLKTLTLFMLSIKGASAIARLTRLTQLELASTLQTHSAEEQSELGSALTALSNLQILRIRHAPPSWACRSGHTSADSPDRADALPAGCSSQLRSLHPAQLCQAQPPLSHCKPVSGQHSGTQAAVSCCHPGTEAQRP